jgi:hypothetical protein
MTIPQSITLNGCTISVKMVKHMFRDYNHYGDYSCFDMDISLDEDMSEQKKEMIFCHELMESVKDIYLLEDLKHEHLQQIAVAIYELIKKKQINF